MPNKNYRNGVALERKVIKELREKGLEGLRTAGSHGVADIVAYSPKSLSMGLVDPLTPNAMKDLVLEGWMRLHDHQIIGDFLYGGRKESGNEKLEYDIHVMPVVACLIQCKRRKR
jgi:hypothetical protein